MENLKQHAGDFLWLDGNYLLTKTESDDNITFKIYDTKHSVFPKGDYLEDGFSTFKKIGSYSFDFTELGNLKFDEFIKSLVIKNIVRDISLYSDFLSISAPKIKNPYDYEFLKLHVSLNAKIASKKQEEFVNNHLKYDPKTIGNKVYMGDWIHLFIGLYSPSMLDALKINEVELDTSVILNKNNRDDEVESTWRNIQAGLMAVRH